MTYQKLNTILAALRFYQHSGMTDPTQRPDWLQDIATDGGMIPGMDTPAAIDALCEEVNVRGAANYRDR